MKSCGDIRDAVLSGVQFQDPEARAHLVECPACAAIAESPGAWRRSLEVASVRSARDSGAQLGAVWEAIDADSRRPAGWLMQRPTGVRVAIAVAACALIVAGVLLFKPRPDLATYPLLRMIATVVALGMFVAITVSLALRPAFKPTPAPRAFYGLLAAAIVTLAITALLPEPDHAGAISAGNGGFFSGALSCFYFGTMIAVPIYVLLRLLDRKTNRLAMIVAAACAGITANLALHVHCPIGSPSHLMLGHVAVAVVFALAVTAWAELRVGSRA